MRSKMEIQTKNLYIEQSKENNTLTCKLKGWLDPNTSPDLIDKLDLTDVNNLVFDMKNVEYVFSAGLRTFLILQRKIEEKKGKLSLINVPDNIKMIFEFAGFASMIDITNDKKD